MSAAEDSTSRSKVPLKTRLGWGVGGLADGFMTNSLNALVMPIYNIALGMDPVRLGVALFIPRFVDAIADPIMGNISDNTRTRWGRRRPYILTGAVLSALLLPLLWMPPWRGQTGMFVYFTAMALAYSLLYTIFVVPYTALGYELTDDYDERTRVLAWRMYIGLLSSLSVPWLYKFCLAPVFHGNTVAGAQWISIFIGLIIIAAGVLPALCCREKKETQKQEQIGIVKALYCTLSNKPFMILQATYVIIICGLFSSSSLGLYINIYYICGGSKSYAATIGGVAGTISALTSYASLPLIAWFAERWGKRNAMIAGLTLGLIGNASLWLTLTPRLPYLQLISSFLASLGMQGCWLMVGSMVADICDEDELQTGLRREGVYGAVNGFALKVSQAMVALLGGLLLRFSGYDANAAEKVGALAASIIATMKFLYINGMCLGLALAIALFLFYPITRQRSRETRRILDERKRRAQSRDWAPTLLSGIESEV